MKADLFYIIVQYTRKAIIFRLLRINSHHHIDIPYLLAIRDFHLSHLSQHNRTIIVDNISKYKFINDGYQFSKYYRYNKLKINIHRVYYYHLYIIHNGLTISARYYNIDGYIITSVANNLFTINYDNNGNIIINTDTQYIVCNPALSRINKYYMKDYNGDILYIQ